MKKAVLLFLSLFILQPVMSQKFKKYPIKSGIIKYETDVMGSKGTAIIYWDDYGYYEKQVDVTPDFSDEDKVETSTVMFVGPKQYIWGNNDEIIRAFTNPIAQIWDEKGYQGNEAITLGEELMKQMFGAPMNGKREFLGKECDVFINEKMKLEALGWNGLSLMVNIGNLSSQTATSIETDIEIPEGTFDLPADKKVDETGGIKLPKNQGIDVYTKPANSWLLMVFVFEYIVHQ